MKTKPVVKLMPSKTEIRILEKSAKELRIACKYVSGLPKPVLKWKDPQGKDVRVCTNLAHQCELTIRNPIYEKDHGRYTCIASSKGGNTNQSIFVNVLGKDINTL